MCVDATDAEGNDGPPPGMYDDSPGAGVYDEVAGCGPLTFSTVG
jgi:hypothetical protein